MILWRERLPHLHYVKFSQFALEEIRCDRQVQEPQRNGAATLRRLMPWDGCR